MDTCHWYKEILPALFKAIPFMHHMFDADCVEWELIQLHCMCWESIGFTGFVVMVQQSVVKWSVVKILTHKVLTVNMDEFDWTLGWTHTGQHCTIGLGTL